MNLALIDTFNKTGFTKPPDTYYKDDPRGPEYGHFEVKEWLTSSPDLIVRKLNQDGDEQYTFLIDRPDFEEWARDCT
jgi:hypothetical protein